MKIPTPDMASDMLLGLGRSHVAALGCREETKLLASAFQPKHDALEAAAATRLQAEKDLTSPRVLLRFAEKSIELAIRQVALLAHATDGNSTSGPAFKALFPNGLNAELNPMAAGQATTAAALRERLNTHPDAVAIKGQILPALEKEMAAFNAALASRDAAEAKLNQARIAEKSARAAFVAAYDSNAGAIRQMFPRSREQQDLFFDEFRSGSRSGGGHDAVTPAPVVASATDKATASSP